MVLQEKDIPNLILNKEYLKDVLNQRLKDIDSRAEKITKISSHKVKGIQKENFFHYVLFNHVTLKTTDNLRKRYIVMCISFSGHGRKKMFQALELAYQRGFNQGTVQVPRPLWYVDELMAVFYVGVPGENLLEFIKNGYLELEHIQTIAQGLSKLHTLSADSLKLKRHSFTENYLDPTNVVNRPYNRDAKLAKDVLTHFDKLKKYQQKIISHHEIALSHGDFHPENIIINKFNNQQFYIIDFSEVCLAPIYFDIASFLQQIEFMAYDYIDADEYKKIEYTFLSSYFDLQTIDQHIMDRINLYKSWTSLKSTVYFMIFKDEANRRFAEYLLTRSEDFLRQIDF